MWKLTEKNPTERERRMSEEAGISDSNRILQVRSQFRSLVIAVFLLFSLWSFVCVLGSGIFVVFSRSSIERVSRLKRLYEEGNYKILSYQLGVDEDVLKGSSVLLLPVKDVLLLVDKTKREGPESLLASGMGEDDVVVLMSLSKRIKAPLMESVGSAPFTVLAEIILKVLALLFFFSYVSKKELANLKFVSSKEVLFLSYFVFAVATVEVVSTIFAMPPSPISSLVAAGVFVLYVVGIELVQNVVLHGEERFFYYSLLAVYLLFTPFSGGEDPFRSFAFRGFLLLLLLMKVSGLSRELTEREDVRRFAEFSLSFPAVWLLAWIYTKSLFTGVIAGLAVSSAYALIGYGVGSYFLSTLMERWCGSTTYRKLERLKSLFLESDNQSARGRLAEFVRKLRKNAPGTYHHQRTVGELAGRAARLTGANALLAEVGGYFHDIGKSENALYFNENSVLKNAYNLPEKSIQSLKESILEHVGKGVEIARSLGLPEHVVDFILEHHSTKGFELVEGEYGYYLGRKPSFKESGIVMIVDKLDALFRSERKSLLEVLQKETGGMTAMEDFLKGHFLRYLYEKREGELYFKGTVFKKAKRREYGICSVEDMEVRSIVEELEDAGLSLFDLLKTVDVMVEYCKSELLSGRTESIGDGERRG